MHEQASVPTPSSGPAPKKPLDTVVKLAISVFVGSFALIWGGMYLSRPDRSIPPYSVGSQNGHLVATHVPPATTDQQIETLLNRFRKVGHQTHDFGSMKVRPTTPDDPGGRYRRILIYVFNDDGWTDPEVLAKYVAGDAAVVSEFEKSVRGYYWLQEQDEEGGLGPLPKPGALSGATRVLFKGRVTDPLPVETESERDTSISPL
ncbi:MAG: hypothetical protein RI101_13200 [Nitrospira sp.]|jgi:hypothetical protein|nr:hypothetical protein [Nitrospira sp.]